MRFHRQLGLVPVVGALLLAGCDRGPQATPAPPEGTHWDSSEGVLSFRRGRRVAAIRFVRVDAGTFEVGGADCAGTILAEGPPRTASIPRAFWLGATEVTRAQWHAFSGEPAPADPELPMTRVSWEQIQTFLKRLEQTSGARFRLPTETEWEYACRAGSRTPWPWEGDRRQLARYGWYLANSGAHLQPVATRLPNPRGLFDMHGNAVEWTQDASGPTNRVLRGGFVLSDADGAACTCRYHFAAGYGFQFAGFRLAAD